jgi:hypothetical protein
MSTSSWLNPFAERVRLHQRNGFGDPMFESPPTVEVEAADHHDTRRLVDALDSEDGVIAYPRWDPRIQQALAGLIADGADGTAIRLVIGVEYAADDEDGLAKFSDDVLAELNEYLDAGICGDEDDEDSSEGDDEDDEDGLSGARDGGDDEDDDSPGAWTAVGVSDPGRIAAEAARLIGRLGRWGTFAIRRHELTESGMLRHVVEIDAELT